MEKWKDIIGLEGRYQISSLGRVKSLKRTCKIMGNSVRTVPEKILKPFINHSGYPSIILCNDTNRRTQTIHRIVARHFLDSFVEEKDVNHIDGDKQNNNYLNLESISEQENVCHYHKNRHKKNPNMNIMQMGNKYRTRVTINGIRKHIGMFLTVEEAQIAYDNFLIENNKVNKYGK